MNTSQKARVIETLSNGNLIVEFVGYPKRYKYTQCTTPEQMRSTSLANTRSNRAVIPKIRGVQKGDYVCLDENMSIAVPNMYDVGSFVTCTVTHNICGDEICVKLRDGSRGILIADHAHVGKRVIAKVKLAKCIFGIPTYTLTTFINEPTAFNFYNPAVHCEA